MRLIYITGSTGLLGGVICDYLLSMGCDFVKINRDDIYDALNSFKDLNLVPNSIVIHCAYDFHDLSTNNGNVNLRLASLFLDACEKSNSVFVNISSLSAYDGCISQYGKLKLSIEKLCSNCNQYSFRLGLFDSNKRIGLINKMVVLQKINPFFFFGFGGINGGQYITNLHQFCIFLKDLFLDHDECRLPPDVYSIVSSDSVHINYILQVYLRKKCIRIHWIFFWLVLKAYEFLHLPNIRLKSDSLIGLANPVRVPMNLINTSLNISNISKT